MAMLTKMKDKLERESSDLKQAKLQVGELSAQLQRLGTVGSRTRHWKHTGHPDHFCFDLYLSRDCLHRPNRATPVNTEHFNF